MKQQYKGEMLKDAYLKEKNNLLDFILREAANTQVYQDRFNPFPIKMEDGFIKEAVNLQKTLIKAVKLIVANYITDTAIQEIIKLDQQACQLISLAQEKPYQLGTLRPDFIIDSNNTLRICEINARFSVNGLIMTNYLANYFSGSSSSSSYLGQQVIATITQFFSSNKPIRIIKGREKGVDIHFVSAEFKKSHPHCDIDLIAPDKLTVKNNLLYAGDSVCDQFILELHQDELVSLPTEVLHHLITKANYFNDIRTILIAHDKRLLSVLGSEAIMLNYLTPAEVNTLQKHIIYSTCINPTTKAEIIKNPGQWVLKKYLSGKGDGMYVGKDSNKQELETVLTQSSHAYVAQQYVKQKKFNVVSEINTEVKSSDKYLVGMLASFNDTPLGVGFFRAGYGSIVNMSTQGGEIIAVA